MQFQKENLIHNYQWSATDAERFVGEPSRRTFDRFNGYQMLLVINSYAKLSGGFSINEGQSIERHLRHKLPEMAISEVSVVSWILQTLNLVLE